MSRFKLSNHFDPGVMVPVLLLMIISVVNLYSAAQGGGAGTPYKGQALWFGIGLLAMGAVMLIDLRTLERQGPLLYALLLIPLVLVHFLGKKVGGATSWLDLGPANLQPSEPMKLALLLMLSRFFARTSNDPPYSVRELLRPLAYVLIPVALILEEPDMGTAIIYLGVAGSLFLFVGISRRTLVGSVAVAATAVLTVRMWKGDPLFFLKAHQKARLATFLNPESDPLGVGYHVIQSKIAIGSGGITGRGYLKGLQTQFSFLPEQHTDFAFCVLAEEFGFIGTFIVITLFSWLIYRAFTIAAQSRDSFACVLATGIGLLLFWHFFINIAMVAGLLPVIGVPLPILSYGGSSAVTFLVAIGLILNIHRSRHLF